LASGVKTGRSIVRATSGPIRGYAFLSVTSLSPVSR
jgi:hypothetical protein